MAHSPVPFPFKSLPPIDPESGELNVIIETPQGSRNKFKFDPALNCFLLHKILPAGAVFPFDFGYIPGTRGADGDPVDILLLLDVPVFTGCLIRSRLVGVLEAEQTEDGEKQRNDRLIGVCAKSEDYADTRSLKDVSPHLLTEIQHFFISYNEEAGKKFKPLGFRSAKTARELLDKAAKRARNGGKS